MPLLSAARVPQSVFDALIERGVHVTQAFGMSAGLFCFTPRDASAEVRAQTLGRPISRWTRSRCWRPAGTRKSRHPEVRDVVVVAMPDERLGERACAYVVAADPSRPPVLDDLTRHMDELGVAKYKWPERLELIEALPRTQVGKITKAALRQDIRRRMGLGEITVG